MSTHFASDTIQYVALGSGWAGVRDGSSSNAVENPEYDEFALYTAYTAGRGAATFYNRRIAFNFDLSGETGGTVVAASFFFYCDLEEYTQGTDARVVASDVTNFSGITADYNNLDFTEPFSNAVTLSTTMGYQEFALNSDALTRINIKAGVGDFQLMLIENDHDFADTTPTIDEYFRVFGYLEPYGNASNNTSRDPKLVLTFEQPIEVNPIKINGGLIVKGGNFKIK